jgi:hypothetical protein
MTLSILLGSNLKTLHGYLEMGKRDHIRDAMITGTLPTMLDALL